MKYSIFCVALISLILSSCKNSNNGSIPTEKSYDIRLDIEGTDAMTFNKKKFSVKEGQKVLLVLKHVGRMSKEKMGHNFVLLKKGTLIGEFKDKASEAKSSDFIPEGDYIIAHTGLIGGGETTWVLFTAPVKGIYDFICSYPGHYGKMKGKFYVEDLEVNVKIEN